MSNDTTIGVRSTATTRHLLITIAFFALLVWMVSPTPSRAARPTCNNDGICQPENGEKDGGKNSCADCNGGGEPPPDTTPPAAIDLDAAVLVCQDEDPLDVSVNIVSLSWPAPLDDKDGRVSSYEIRYRLGIDGDPTAENWDDLETLQFPGHVDPAAPSQPEGVNVKGLAEFEDYAFAVRSRDRDGNLSDLSNTFSVTTGLRLEDAWAKVPMPTGGILQMTPDGRPAFAIFDFETSEVLYHECDSNCLSTEPPSPVLSPLETVGTFSFSPGVNLGFDLEGKPAITFSTKNPFLARRTAPGSEPGSWVVEQIGSRGGGTAWIEFDADGTPMVAFNGNHPKAILRFAERTAPGWQVETVDDQVSDTISIQVKEPSAAPGTRVIAYETTNAQGESVLKVASKALGGAWTTVEIEPNGFEPSLAFDGDLPIIVHGIGSEPDALRMVRCTSPECAEYESEGIAPSAGGFYQFAYDSTQRIAYVAFLSSPSPPNYTHDVLIARKHLSSDPSAPWQMSVVESNVNGSFFEMGGVRLGPGVLPRIWHATADGADVLSHPATGVDPWSIDCPFP